MEQEQLAIEQQRLHETTRLIAKKLQSIVAAGDALDTDLKTAQENLEEYATRDIVGIGSKEDFEDLVELSEYMHQRDMQAHSKLKQTDELKRLKRLKGTPYFARIDFLQEGESQADKVYIGRATVMDDDSLDIMVYDWRSPIASLFYRYGTGPAAYDAPKMKVQGKMLLKRQFEIKRGELLYYFDSDLRVSDGYLRELLSKPSSTEMKSIVETIQMDQDAVIRDTQSDLCMVQGAAGSGKTAVALHRIAYLMYQGLANRLNASQMVIISPSALFEKYIGSVLPDLGEESVNTYLMTELIRLIMPEGEIESKEAYLERAMQGGALDAFIGTEAFAGLLDRYVAALPKQYINYQDISYDGVSIATKDMQKTVILNGRKQTPVGIRLKWLEKSLWEKIHPLRPNRLEKVKMYYTLNTYHVSDADAYARMEAIADAAALKHQIQAYTVADCKALYRKLFTDKERYAALSDGCAMPEALREQVLARLDSGVIGYQDAAAIAYLTARVNGCEAFLDIRQVVVDEAQDFSPLHYALMRLLFPKARFTLLGDMNQTITHKADATMYDKAKRMLGKDNATLKTLNKSFRSTRQIFAFASRFLQGDAGECFGRDGEEPRVLVGGEDALLATINTFKEKGDQTVAVLVKTAKEARTLYDALKDKLRLTLVTEDFAGTLSDVALMPVYMAKGLEFDAVIVPNADKAHYATEQDRQLLYIAATRALHHLTLLYQGESSPWIGGVNDDL